MNYFKSIAVFAVTAHAQLEYPGDYCCNLYPATRYGMDPKSVCYDPKKGGKQLTDLTNTSYHDVISSWWCGKNVSYDFCYASTGSCDAGNG